MKRGHMSTENKLIIEESTAMIIRGIKQRVRNEQTKNVIERLFVFIDVDLIGGCKHV